MSPLYLLEKLSNLKQLKLFYTPKFAPERYKITVEDKFVIFMRKDNKKDSIKICFDCQVDKEQTACDIKGKSLCLTLPITQDSFNDETDDFPTPNELDIAKYCLIKCRFCENTIYCHSAMPSDNCEKLSKIYPLPSEYWLELSDMWFCCQSHQIDFNAQQIRAKKNALLIGKLFIILHSSNICSKSLKLTPRLVDDEYSVNTLSEKEQQRKDDKHTKITHSCCSTMEDHEHSETESKKDEHDTENEPTSWHGVKAFNCYCNRCQTLLGISYKSMKNEQNDQNNEQLDEYHLMKFELLTEGKYEIPFARNQSKMDSVYHWYCVENFFSTKILETKKARVVHKFLVYDNEYSVFIRINLLSTDCMIKCPLFIESSESEKMAPVLKILFVDVSDFSFEENEQWVKEQNGHSITSSTENCKLLLTYLEKYSKLYPPTIQKQMFASNMKMTFLRLLSRTFQN